MRTLIAGCGYVGTALGRSLVAEGHTVWGLRRDPSGLPPEIKPVAADLAQRADLASLPAELDYVVYSASAGESSEGAYRRAYVTGLANLLAAVKGETLRRFFFISSTAVYAQADGSWVDETSETAPAHFTGRVTLEAEQLVEQSGAPHTVLRCAGIYGPGRTRLVESVREGSARGSRRFTNRIHRDDIAGAIRHLIQSDAAPARLILCDDEPCPQLEVMRFVAARLGVPAPAAAESDGPEARGGHKRCRNDRLKATGYQLEYPTYREGYAAMLTMASS